MSRPRFASSRQRGMPSAQRPTRHARPTTISVRSQRRAVGAGSGSGSAAPGTLLEPGRQVRGEEPVEEVLAALAAHAEAARAICARRQAALDRLADRGVLVLDALPDGEAREVPLARF